MKLTIDQKNKLEELESVVNNVVYDTKVAYESAKGVNIEFTELLTQLGVEL